MNNDNKIQDPYINFPLHLIKGVWHNKVPGINKIIENGIFNFALNDTGFVHEPTEDELKNTLAEFKDFIPKKYNTMPKLIFSIFNKEYTFNQIKNNENKLYQFKIFNRTYQAMRVLGVNIPDIESFLVKFKNFIKETENAPSKTKISAKLHTLFLLRDTEQNDNALFQFFLYLAIRSTMGIRQYNDKPTYKSVIFSRMFGYESFDAAPEKIKNQKPHKFYMDSKKYRYHQDKLLAETCKKWKLIKYAKHTHGMYFSLQKFGEENLIRHVLKQKYKVDNIMKQKRFEQKEGQIIDEIKRELSQHHIYN